MKNIEAGKPFFANGNSASAPIFIARVIFAVTAALHCMVSKVKFCSDMLGVRPSFAMLDPSAPARERISTVQVVFANYGASAAVALTKKMNASSLFGSQRNYNQFTKAFSNHWLIVRAMINEFKSLRTFGLIAP